MSDITGNAEVVNTITLTGNINFTPTLVGVAWGKITGTLADQEDLQSELDLLHSQDVALSSLIDKEQQRAVSKEKVLNDAIADLETDLNSEIARAKARENEIEKKIPTDFYTKEEVDKLIQSVFDEISKNTYLVVK